MLTYCISNTAYNKQATAISKPIQQLATKESHYTHKHDMKSLLGPIVVMKTCGYIVQADSTWLILVGDQLFFRGGGEYVSKVRR